VLFRSMLGSNRAHLERQLPQIREIIRSSLSETVEAADVVVVSQRRPEFGDALQRLNGTAVVDLVSIESAAAAAASGGGSW